MAALSVEDDAGTDLQPEGRVVVVPVALLAAASSVFISLLVVPPDGRLGLDGFAAFALERTATSTHDADGPPSLLLLHHLRRRPFLAIDYTADEQPRYR